MNNCEYGCGQPATYYKLPTSKVPKGRYSCAPSPNSCPAKRQKTTGDKNPSKRETVRKIISEKNKILFANGSPIRKRCQETLLEKYGVDNPAKNPDFYKKIIEKRKNTGSYAYRKEMNSQAANLKRKKTRIERGYDIDPDLKSDFDQYESEVDRLTEKAYKKYKEIINPNNLKRGRIKGSYQLDHIYSKSEGFKNKIPPHIISHPANLRMLTINENISKSYKSDITIQELLEKIDKF